MTSSTCKPHIACFGEAMVELMLSQNGNSDATLGFAGDSLNTAIYLQRLLGSKARVSFITKFGRDSLSTRATEFIAAESISVDKISFSNDRSIGLYAIETDASGERSFSYWRGQSAARTLFQTEGVSDFSQLSGCDYLCFSAISLAILPQTMRLALLEELTRLRATGNVKIVFDSNYRPALWENVETAQTMVAAAWRVTDIALPSIDDEQELFGDKDEASVVARLHSYGIQTGALKRGEAGPRALGPAHNQQDENNPAEFSTATSVVDTTAAGDSFNAGYLSGILAGKTQAESLLDGHDCSLRVIANKGAIIPRESW